MKVFRQLDYFDGTLTLSVRVSFDEDESLIINQLGLASYRVRTRDGLFAGLDTVPRNVKAAYRTQLGRVKNRWSAPLAKTSGFAIVDIASSMTDFVASKILAFLALGLGRRRRLANVIAGLSISSRRIERIKEAEFFIFFSLAAIAKAIEYARDIGNEIEFDQATFLMRVEGLDFAGAGSDIEDELDALMSAIKSSARHDG